MRDGYSVKIRRNNGSWFLCASGLGILPPVWPLSERRQAVQHRDDLIAHGFVARLTRVQFQDVEPVQPAPRARPRPPAQR